MSLVGSVEPSDASYRSLKLYSGNESSDSACLPSRMFSSEKPRNVFTSSSDSSESYEKYFLDSPVEDLTHLSSSGTSWRQQSEFQADFDISQISQSVYDEEKMRLKLRELERVLLDDNVFDEDCNAYSADHMMEIDHKWYDTIENEQLHHHESPMESSSVISNLSSISNSSKEVSELSSMTPKQMLIRCACELSEGNVLQASAILNKLSDSVSIQGDPSQRIAAYMVEGLTARMASSGKFLYKALRCKEPPSSERLAAMQILFEACPCFKFGFLAANEAIIEALKNEKIAHIIDFDINQGNQYVTLIQTIASLPDKRPRLRLTGIDDPESIQRPTGGLKIVGLRLEKLAEILGVQFEFQAVPSETSNVTPSMLNTRPEEALIVNFAFQLHHMPDESVSTVNQRDRLLQMAKSLNPKLVTVVEQDMNTNTNPFFPRFLEAYEYYSAVFESLDATLPRESQDRMNVERHCLAREIVNIVACEGEERVERYEVAGKWRARMVMAGFNSCPMSCHVVDPMQELIKEQYYGKFKLKEEFGALHFGWEDQSLIVASAWN